VNVSRSGSRRSSYRVGMTVRGNRKGFSDNLGGLSMDGGDVDATDLTLLRT
jgi:hypothetical protein